MTNSKKTLIIALIIDFLILFGIVLAKPISKIMINTLPDCPFRTYYSVLCPSCGATRAVFNLFSGNFLTAFRFNQYFFILAFYLIIAFLFMNLAFVFNLKNAKRIFFKIINYKVIIALTVLWVLFGIVRNIILF